MLKKPSVTSPHNMVWKLNTSNLGKFEEFKRLFSQEGRSLETTHIDLEEIEGASVGVNIRWLLDHLKNFVGKKAEGTVLGTIVSPQGSAGFGFDPVFKPDGSEHTLAESKPDSVNARAKAVHALIQGDLHMKNPAIDTWDGPWQKNL